MSAYVELIAKLYMNVICENVLTWIPLNSHIVRKRIALTSHYDTCSNRKHSQCLHLSYHTRNQFLDHVLHIVAMTTVYRAKISIMRLTGIQEWFKHIWCNHTWILSLRGPRMQVRTIQNQVESIEDTSNSRVVWTLCTHVLVTITNQLLLSAIQVYIMGPVFRALRWK